MRRLPITSLISSMVFATAAFAYEEQIYFGKDRVMTVARDKCVGAILWKAEGVTSQELKKVSSAYGKIGRGQYTYFCADFADGVQCDCSHRLFSGVDGASCRKAEDVHQSCLANINDELRRANLPPIGGKRKARR